MRQIRAAITLETMAIYLGSNIQALLLYNIARRHTTTTTSSLPQALEKMLAMARNRMTYEEIVNCYA